MKTKLILLSIFLFSTCISSSKAPTLALDEDGKPLRTDAYYYIRPANHSTGAGGGGLGLRSIGNDTCPLGVIQEINELRDGLPLTFSPVHHKKGLIHVSTDLNIQYSFPDSCNQSMVWRLEQYDQSTGKYFIGIGGVAGNPGRKTLSNWFKIENFGKDYKLVFCPTVCKYCKVICKDVGIFYYNGLRRLALSDEPYKFIFRQA